MVRAQTRDEAGGVMLGTVLDTAPWEVELHNANIVLDEGALVLSQWVETYDAVTGVDSGDTAVLVELEDGDHLVFDIITNTAPKNPEPTYKTGEATATITSGDVTKAFTVTHGVGSTPSAVLLTTSPGGNPDGRMVHWEVETISGTTFAARLTVSSAYGADRSLSCSWVAFA